MLDVAIAETEGAAGHVDRVGAVPGMVHDTGGVMADRAEQVADFVCHCETQKEIRIDTELFGELLNARPNDGGVITVRRSQSVSDGVGITLRIEGSVLANDAETERPVFDGASLGRQHVLGIGAEPPMCWYAGFLKNLLRVYDGGLYRLFGCSHPVKDLDMGNAPITNRCKPHDGKYL